MTGSTVVWWRGDEPVSSHAWTYDSIERMAAQFAQDGIPPRDAETAQPQRGPDGTWTLGPPGEATDEDDEEAGPFRFIESHDAWLKAMRTASSVDPIPRLQLLLMGTHFWLGDVYAERELARLVTAWRPLTLDWNPVTDHVNAIISLMPHASRCLTLTFSEAALARALVTIDTRQEPVCHWKRSLSPLLSRLAEIALLDPSVQAAQFAQLFPQLLEARFMMSRRFIDTMMSKIDTEIPRAGNVDRVFGPIIAWHEAAVYPDSPPGSPPGSPPPTLPPYRSPPTY